MTKSLVEPRSGPALPANVAVYKARRNSITKMRRNDICIICVVQRISYRCKPLNIAQKLSRKILQNALDTISHESTNATSQGDAQIFKAAVRTPPRSCFFYTEVREAFSMNNLRKFLLVFAALTLTAV